ncbi:unnamed protein product [Cuscuta campestris]|uniref:Uncharacterized protein n=1 Tax=Cuscuta campestris TaxID=132261 RepID=A0A484LEE2_9ASTE|nr:unnamed protein product [Cuscuta campestris]
MGKDKSRAGTSGKSKSKSRAPTSSSEERLYYGDGSYLWWLDKSGQLSSVWRELQGFRIQTIGHHTQKLILI